MAEGGGWRRALKSGAQQPVTPVTIRGLEDLKLDGAAAISADGEVVAKNAKSADENAEDKVDSYVKHIDKTIQEDASFKE